MCLPGALVRSALVLLCFASSSCGKRTCDYKEIFDTYREFILVDLNNLNLTGASTQHKGRDPCPSRKAHRILVSIYGMAQQVRCQRGRKQPSVLERPVERMEDLIKYNCNSNTLGRRVVCSGVQKPQGKKKRKKRILIKAINALVVCWQKFQSVYALQK